MSESPPPIQENVVSSSATPTIGQKIDTVIEPYVRDEAQLQERAADLESQIEALGREVQDVQRDLGVVRSAKIEALREASKSDALLRAVFGLASDESAEATLSLAVDSAGSDTHPLLSPAG